MEGNRRTALGPVPEGWSTCRLEDASEFITKGTTPTTLGFDWVDQGVPFLRSECVAEKGFSRNGLSFISQDAHKALARSVVRSGDILITITGNVGRACIYPNDMPEANINQHIARIRINGNVAVLPGFVHAVLSTTKYRRHFERIVTGLAYPQISLKQVREIVIPQPPANEQFAIVAVLSTWDRAIEQVSRLIDAKTRLKKGLMQQLLTGKRRFPEFEGTEWREYRLGELFRERKERGSLDLPLLSITADRGVISREEVDRKDTSNPVKEKYLRIKPGDIGYNTMRMWQGVSGLSQLDGIVSPAYTIVMPSKQVLGNYAAHLFKFPPMIHLFHRHSQGLVNDTLNLKYRHFSEIKVTVPSVPEQERIAGVLNGISEEMSRLTDLEDALQRQKRGLMQVLLTGRKRVKIKEPTKGRVEK